MSFIQNRKTIDFLLAQPTATGMGGYCLGLVVSWAQHDHVVAPDALLEEAVRCETIDDARKLYRIGVTLAGGAGAAAGGREPF